MFLFGGRAVPETYGHGWLVDHLTRDEHDHFLRWYATRYTETLSNGRPIYPGRLVEFWATHYLAEERRNELSI